MTAKLWRYALAALCLAMLLLVTSGEALADNNPLITLDENGHGSLLFPGGSPIPTVGVLTADPGPGGGAAALTYNLLGPPSLIAGDLLLLDPGNSVVSDIIRFNPAGTGNPGYPASAVFYSILGQGSLADTGFPSALYTNTFSVTEVNGQFLYTPLAGQPGFVAGFSVTYHIISDAPVPEPVTIVLLGTGLAGIVVKMRKRRKTV